MNKAILATTCLFFATFGIAHSQNVGIGTTNPTEKLDVSGNLNLSGQLKLSGDAGQPGNLLMVGQDGNPTWGIAQQFTRFMRSYLASTSVIIPASAKTFMVEAWGAGGGGAQGGGGASGNYVMAVFSNDANTTLTITIGDQGNGALAYTDPATSGGSTIVSGTNISVTAGGGRGANAFYGGLLPQNGAPGGTATGSALLQSLVINGENGQPTTQTSSQVSSTTWHSAVQFGRGGHGVLDIGQGGPGSFRVHLTTVAYDGSYVKLYQGGYAGIASGGGGGQRLGYGWGWDGGKGYVIVRY